MAQQRTDLDTLWRAIEQAGSVEQYVASQLSENGFVVERADTANMSKRELAQYKKQLKAEAAEKRRLKAEAWAAYKANHIVHLGEDIYWNELDDYDKWDLENAEERAAENELPPLDNPGQLAEALEIDIRQLRWMAYHLNAATKIHYRRFTIPKKDGTDRAIWAPLPKLKKAQWWILHNIVERLPVHGAAHGFLPGRSILTNARAHRDSKIVLQMDIKDFFPTVTLPRVRGIFRKAGYRYQVATLLALLCTEAPRQVVEHDGKSYFVSLGPRCLPQGAPTSPGLTNTLSLRMDRRIQGLAKVLGWRYTRYADDLTLSLPSSHKGQPQLGKLMGSVKRIVEAEGFRVNRKKTRIMRTGSQQKVTGLIVNGEEPPRVPRRIRRQIRAAFHNLKNGKPLKDGETANTLRGYAAYIYMTDPELGGKFLSEFD